MEIPIENQFQNQSIFQAPTPKPKNKFGKIVLVIIGVLILLVFMAFLYLNNQFNQSYSADASTKSFVINHGESVQDIATDLQAKGIIGSSTFFTWLVRLQGNSAKIQSGVYSLSASQSMREILNQITTGSHTYEVIKIQEGWNIRDIGDYLDQNNLITKADWLSAVDKLAKTYNYFGENPQQKNLEGYLFPDTYYITKGSDPALLVQKMLDNTDQKITAQMRADIAANHQSIYQILTLASIIEDETGRNKKTVSAQDLQTLEQERKTVAGLFYNRLKIGMPLQSDATINYITRTGSASATYYQLKIDSPYNTYKYAGLPPGPIGNPSFSSIMAAVYPTQSDYLYFLTKPDGTAIFAKTLQEQLANKTKYLR